VTTTANFAVWRFQHDATDVYVGRYVNVLVRVGAGLMFRERRVILDLETLRPHGKLSFIPVAHCYQSPSLPLSGGVVGGFLPRQPG
jgi:hypothetical protein